MVGVSPKRRRLLSRFLAGLAVFATLFAAIASYAEQTLFESDTFANRAVSVLDDPAVQNQLSAAITDAAIAQAPNAVAARPLIEGVAGLLVRSPALQTLLSAGVRDVHATVIAGNQDTLIVTLENIGVLIKQGLQAAAPKLSKQISRQLDIEIVNEGEAGDEGIVIDAAQLGHDLDILHWILLAFALVAAGGSIHLARSRLEGIRRIGRSLAIGAVAAVIVWQVGRTLIVGQFEGDAADVARAVYDAFLIDLRTWLLVLAGTGIVITAGATSTREPIDVAGIVARAWGRLTTAPEGTPGRILRALLLVAVGILVLSNRAAFIDLTVIVIAAFVTYVGAAELMRLAAGAVREGEVTETGEPDLSTGGLARVIGVGALLLGGFVLLGLGSNSEETPPLTVDTCNGHVELCDRTLDEVAFAGTHNSMSAATYSGWFFAQQEKGISQQLNAGIRALLIDPHYGFPTKSGRIGTDLESDLGSRQKIEAGLGPEAIAATEQIRGTAGFQRAGDTDVYLCHGFCEPGAFTWVDGLREVRDFLLANPGEVVLMSIEDATTPEDTVAGFDAAKLTDFVYTGEDPVPTLREMIDSNQRLYVMAERDGGDPPWYRKQFEITQETPFSFSRPEQLEKPSSCDENRGPPDAPFFLLNHWIDTSPAPRPTNAKIVNQKDFLLDRVAMCEEIRGVQPKILAIDFYEEGDVVAAVDELNGVAE